MNNKYLVYGLGAAAALLVLLLLTRSGASSAAPSNSGPSYVTLGTDPAVAQIRSTERIADSQNRATVAIAYIQYLLGKNTNETSIGITGITETEATKRAKYAADFELALNNQNNQTASYLANVQQNIAFKNADIQYQIAKKTKGKGNANYYLQGLFDTGNKALGDVLNKVLKI